MSKSLKGLKSYDDKVCCPESTPIGIHIAAIVFICGIPVLYFISLANYKVASFVAVSTILPRIIGTCFPNNTWINDNLTLPLYWNICMLFCFSSPFFIIAGLINSTKVFLPALIIYIFLAYRNRHEFSGGGAFKVWAKNEWGYKALRKFLDLTVHVSKKSADLDPKEKVIFAVHPHGTSTDYRILLDGMLYKVFPDRTILTLVASVLFTFPLVRELCLWTRCIDARKKYATKALQKGHSLLIIPGGEAEQIATQRGVESVYLAKRVGFIKLALENNCPVVPCYVFGAVDLYYVTKPSWIQEWLRKKMGVCIPLYCGNVGFCPLKIPNNMVVGDPLILPACKELGSPSEEEISNAHSLYIQALQELFDKCKACFGYADRKLIIT